MGRPRKIQTPGVTELAEQLDVAKQVTPPIEQELHKEESTKPQEPADPSRPKRWVLQADGWHYE